MLGLFEAFTLYVLAKFAERYTASNYSVLVRKALGRKLSACETLVMQLLAAGCWLHVLTRTLAGAGLSAILLLYLWGSCIAYLVIIGDSFSSIASLVTGEHPPGVQGCRPGR